MARDLLCIPLAGVGVERTFNFARDICHYRRGQLSPDTIRALILVYHSQIQESRLEEFQRIYSSSQDIQNMTEEEIELEIQEQEGELGILDRQIDQWDQDHYISDIEEEEGIPAPTARIKQRLQLSNRQNNSQSLSISNRRQYEAERQARIQQDQQDRQILGLYDIPLSDGGSISDNNEDLYIRSSPPIMPRQSLSPRLPTQTVLLSSQLSPIPTQRVVQTYSRKRNAIEILENVLAKK